MSTSTRAVLRGRRLAERLMTSRCVITRGGSSTYDPATLVLSPGAGDVVYDDPTTPGAGAKCRIKSNARFDHVVDAGEQPVSTYRLVLALPVAAPALQVDDRVLMIASEMDPQLPGVVLRVREPEFGDQITARRCSVEVDAG